MPGSQPIERNACVVDDAKILTVPLNVENWFGVFPCNSPGWLGELGESRLQPGAKVATSNSAQPQTASCTPRGHLRDP